MSENEITFACFHCFYCDHETDANGVIPRFEEGNGFECVDEAACKRRQKRDAILAETLVHPVDKFSFASIAICAGVLVGIIVVGLLFLFGF